MLNRFKASYTAHSWVRRGSGVALCVSAFLLAALTGGFPPWAWRLLFHALPQLPRLWGQRGPGILAPLLGLGLRSLTLVILWGLVLAAAAWMALRWWRARDARPALEEEIDPTLYQSPEQDDLYNFLPSSSRPGENGATPFAAGAAALPSSLSNAAQNGHQSAQPMPRTARNLRFDVPLHNGYRRVPTAPAAPVAQV